MPAVAKPFETKALGLAPDATAPDGTAVRLLLSLEGGSMAHFELPAGAVSHPVTHRTVEEFGSLRAGGAAFGAARTTLNDRAYQGVLTIPLGTVSVPRPGGAPLSFVTITMPPWPGWRGLPVPGRSPPTIAAGPA